MDERLGDVSPHLMLAGVVLLAEQLGWAAGGAGAFVPCARLHRMALLIQAEGDEEAAEQERSLGFGQRLVVMSEAIGVAVECEVAQIGAQSFHGARIVGCERAAQPR